MHAFRFRLCWILIVLVAWTGGGGLPAAADTKTAQAAVAPDPGLSIPVLCYHRFGNYPANDAYAVTLKEFSRQLAIIHDEGFTPITASQLAAGLDGKAGLPAKPLLITVDDGYKDFVTRAQPLLEKYKYPATLYVYTCFVNSKHGLSAVDLKNLETAGYEIGSHSATHPMLTKHPADETGEQRARRLKAELADSREQLRQWSGGEVRTLAYPYGLWDQEVAAAAKAAGYALMFTVNPGNNAVDAPKECINRLLILHGTRERTFRALLRDQPLPIAVYSPELGQHLVGPVSEVSVELKPEIVSRIAPASLSAKWGTGPMSVTFDPGTRQARLKFSHPWHRGTNLITLSARDLEGKSTFKTGWLVIVDPASQPKGL